MHASVWTPSPLDVTHPHHQSPAPLYWVLHPECLHAPVNDLHCQPRAIHQGPALPGESHHRHMPEVVDGLSRGMDHLWDPANEPDRPSNKVFEMPDSGNNCPCL